MDGNPKLTHNSLSLKKTDNQLAKQVVVLLFKKFTNFLYNRTLLK